MRGRFGTSRVQAETETRHAEFVGDVQAANATVSQPNNDIDFDGRHGPDYLFLSSDVLHVYSEPQPKGPAKQLLNARGNANAQTADRIIQADRITFDSSTDLAYAYGDGDKEVVMVEQGSPNQKPSTLRGKAGRYNRRTKEGKIEDPQAIQFFDRKTGERPRSFFPDLGGTPKPGDPIKPKRLPFQMSPRNSTERKGFTGGT